MPTDIPLRLVADEDDPDLFLPYVQVDADGVRIEALLDSGAARTRFLERPGLTATDSEAHVSSGAFGVSTTTTRSATVHCRLGGLDVAQVSAALDAPEAPGPGDLVGQDVLGRLTCLYRLAAGLLTVDPEPPASTHPIHVGERGHVYLDAVWSDGPTAYSVFDTGASVTVVDAAFAARHPGLFTSLPSSSGTDASGLTMETPMAHMRGPRLLGEQLSDSLVAIVDLSGPNRTLQRPMDLILGWPITSQADWYVDHGRALAACMMLRPGQVG